MSSPTSGEEDELLAVLAADRAGVGLHGDRGTPQRSKMRT